METSAKPKSGFRLFAGDKVLWIILALLAIISVLVVYSSAAKMGYDPRYDTTTTRFLTAQLVRLLGCAALLALLHKINCQLYNRLSRVLFWGSAALTIAAYFIGTSHGDASRWIFGIQPSEALKISTVIFMARQLSVRQSTIDRQRIVPTLMFWRWFSDPAQQKIWRDGTWPIVCPVVFACAVIVKDHSSSALLVFIISLVMMYVGRVKAVELLKLVGLASVAVCLLVMMGFGRANVIKQRMGMFFGREVNTEHVVESTMTIDKLSDTERALVAIHKGGLTGSGAGHSTMRVLLTHPESDYIYALFVEEYGLFLALVLMSFYLWISVRGIAIFTRCETAFPGLMVLGLVLLITIQALMHIMVSLGLFPETGQNLPFVSHGGSSLLFSTWAMSIVLSVSRQNDEKSHVKPRGESILEKR